MDVLLLVWFFGGFVVLFHSKRIFLKQWGFLFRIVYIASESFWELWVSTVFPLFAVAKLHGYKPLALLKQNQPDNQANSMGKFRDGGELGPLPRA